MWAQDECDGDAGILLCAACKRGSSRVFEDLRVCLEPSAVDGTMAGKGGDIFLDDAEIRALLLSGGATLVRADAQSMPQPMDVAAVLACLHSHSPAVPRP